MIQQDFTQEIVRDLRLGTFDALEGIIRRAYSSVYGLSLLVLIDLFHI